MFLLHVQNHFCSHFLLCDALRVFCLYVKEMLIFCLKEYSFFILGQFVLSIKLCKTTEGQKSRCIQLVLTTHNTCVQFNKAKRFQLFHNIFVERTFKKGMLVST